MIKKKNGRAGYMPEKKNKHGGGGLRIWNFQGLAMYQRNSLWNFQGLIKNKVEFTRATKKKWCYCTFVPS